MRKKPEILSTEIIARSRIFSIEQLELQFSNGQVAHFERRERVEKIASAMESKGLDTDTSYDQKVDALMGHDNLDVVEQAINMSAPQIKLAAVSDNPGNPSDATSAFAAGILDD